MNRPETTLRHSDGPTVLVDEEDNILFLYLPEFAKEATHVSQVLCVSTIIDNLIEGISLQGARSEGGPVSQLGSPKAWRRFKSWYPFPFVAP